MRKIFYWSPFFSDVATIKAVTRSLVSLTKFPQDQKFKVSLIDAIGEWEQNEDIIKNKISNPKELKKFKAENYSYNKNLSSDSDWIFTR